MIVLDNNDVYDKIQILIINLYLAGDEDGNHIFFHIYLHKNERNWIWKLAHIPITFPLCKQHTLA